MKNKRWKKELFRIFIVIIICAVYNFISFLRNGVWNQDTIFMGIFSVVIFTVCIVIRREISR